MAHSPRGIGGASSGMTMTALIPAGAQYTAQAAPALPLVGMAKVSTPSSLARETPTAAPRALKVPVGIIPSSFRKRWGISKWAPRFRRGRSGVIPSPREIIFFSSLTGRSSRYRHRVGSRPNNISFRITALIWSRSYATKRGAPH